jgi:hypothetical protein
MLLIIGHATQRAKESLRGVSFGEQMPYLSLTS